MWKRLPYYEQYVSLCNCLLGKNDMQKMIDIPARRIGLIVILTLIYCTPVCAQQMYYMHFPVPHNSPVRRVNIREFTLADVKSDTCLLYIDYILESNPIYLKDVLLLKMSTFQMDCCRHVIWRRKWQPTPVFLPGKSQAFYRRAWWATVHGVAKSLTE